MKKFLQQNYKLIIVLIMIVAMWLVFYRSEFLSDQKWEINASRTIVYLQALLIKEALILISGSLLLWVGGKNKK